MGVSDISNVEQILHFTMEQDHQTLTFPFHKIF